MNFFRLNRFLACAALLLSAPLVFAQISFSALNLNEEDEVLFALNHRAPGSIEYSTIFKSKIKNGTAQSFPQAISCFPEALQGFDEGKKLHIRNRYGAAIYDFESETLQWTENFETFSENYSAPQPVLMNATGKWSCRLEHTDLLRGRLVVKNNENGKTIVIDDNCVFSYSKVPVKWSPDGKFFVYEKNGAVYFCDPETLFSGRALKEDFRKICTGSINSAEWKGNDKIVYISSDLIFEIGTKEVITFGLYSQFIPLGKIIGRLPQKFDCNEDRFWANKEATDFLIVRRDETVAWYRINIGGDGGAFVQTVFVAPFFERGMTPISFDVFWTENTMPVLCVKLAQSGNGKETSVVYTLELNGRLARRVFVQDTNASIAISPNKKHFAFLSDDIVYVYNTANWRLAAEIKGEGTVSISWRDSTRLCLGGVHSVKEFSMVNYTLRILFASSANIAWWLNENEIALRNESGRTYIVDIEKGLWREELQRPIPPQIQNERYRIFAGATKNALYQNALYVRTLTGKITTKPLVDQSARPAAPRKKVALIFDAMEDSSGMDSILALCNEHNIKCTFFFSGEFIRRYPAETKKIAETQNECAAIFFNNVNLLDKFIYADKLFISKGLARLEDEFFSSTGKELSLYWHAPYHKDDKKVRDEGSAAGYTYVDIKSPNIVQISAGDQRLSDTALYEKFNLLLNELFAAGMELVTISELGQ